MNLHKFQALIELLKYVNFLMMYLYGIYADFFHKSHFTDRKRDFIEGKWINSALWWQQHIQVETE